MMDLKVLKWQMLRGTLMKRMFVRAFALGSALLVFSIIQMTHEARNMEPVLLDLGECPLNFGSSQHYNVSEFLEPLSVLGFPLYGGFGMLSKESETLAKNVFKELMGKNFLDPNSKTLCVGEGSASAVLALRELGFPHAVAVSSHPSFFLLKRRFVCELDFADNSFDFVFSRVLDRVSLPALLVLEIERVLRPGAIGAMLVGAHDLHSGSLIRSATPVSLYLRISDIIHVCGVGANALVIFKKKFKNAALFEHFQLPKECPAITNNQPLMKFIEPLVDEHSPSSKLEVAYLPTLLDTSTRKRVVYINVGIGESTNMSVQELLKPYSSLCDRAFSIFIIDHNTSVLSAHVKTPGITFIYHPGLAEDNAAPELDSDEYLSAPMDLEGFDFTRWFTETVEDGDFVVLRINARTVKLNILEELFKYGAICRVDELFLQCSESLEDLEGANYEDCMSLLKSLRNSGVFVHQWLGN